MELKTNWCCVFDLENTQEAYANVMKTLMWLENLSNNRFQETNISDNVYPFKIVNEKRENLSKKEKIFYLERILDEDDAKKIKEIKNKKQIIDGLSATTKQASFSYYFRINLNSNSDVVDLRFFVLILQSLSLVATKTIVRLYKKEKNGKWNTSDYFKCSNYLRFIQEKYPIFFANYNENFNSITTLTTKNIGTQKTFLPLLEINTTISQTLSRRWHIRVDFEDQKYSELYKAVKFEDCEDELSNQLLQIGMKILFNSLAGVEYNTKEKKLKLLNYLADVINRVDGITSIDALLFGALTAKEIYNEKKLVQLLFEIQRLSEATGQIIENAAFHSQHHQGVFTFRIQSNLKYIEENYPRYSLPNSSTSCVEILVADSNTNEGIFSNFLNSNKATNLLREYANKISLSNFYGYYENNEIEELWKKSRKDSPAMCHGMLSFATAINNLGGAFWVRSSSDFTTNDPQNYFYHNAREAEFNTYNDYSSTWLPGTQISVIIRTKNIEKQISENIEYGKKVESQIDYTHSLYTTTYDELAQALFCDSKVSSLCINAQQIYNIEKKVSHLQGQRKKDEIAMQWEDFLNLWLKSYASNEDDKSTSEKHIVFDLDLIELCAVFENSISMSEPFWKGFFASGFFDESNKSKKYVLIRNISTAMSRFMYETLTIFANTLNINNVCVYLYQQTSNNDYLPYSGTTIYSLLHKISSTFPEEPVGFPRLFPYSLFIKNDRGITLFEQNMIEKAERSISESIIHGYKISNTHMRLGNKVHLDDFYEMALFFQNPNNAYYTAFLLLKSLLLDDKILEKKHILFYGYASYSRAILWAAIQILLDYFKKRGIKNPPSCDFIIYQNDLKLESNQPKTQMYYSKKEWQENPKYIYNPEDTLLISIVPISSSLTTFKKMVLELNTETEKSFVPQENFTAFWVRDEFSNKPVEKLSETLESQGYLGPTEDEKFFWDNVDPNNKKITSTLIGYDINYLVHTESFWRNPLECEKCYPGDVLLEYPLVETDPTSTVPTQQFFLKKECNDKPDTEESNFEIENDTRFSHLMNNIYYGHISRGKNHYLYYVRSREYFQQESQNIAMWLKELLRMEKSPQNKVINVLVVPQQIDNVEFAQYVYDFYFKGEAEAIIFNSEKEFRSNFQAEYSELFRRLSAQKKRGYIIKFNYIDTSIRTGDTFNRVLSLINSCWQSNGNSEYIHHFDKVFVLVNRLSEHSKCSYVLSPKDNFHAYVNINISAMRTFGDSCVSCKIQQEAKHYFKCAATKNISAYWENKQLERSCIPFDIYSKSNSYRGYLRMACAHRMAKYVQYSRGKDIKDYFTTIRNFFSEISKIRNERNGVSPVYQVSYNGNSISMLDWFSAGLKVLVRPFFSYDFKMRCAVMDLLLVMAELFFGNDDLKTIKLRLVNSDKAYLVENDNIEWIHSFLSSIFEEIIDDPYAQIEFMRSNVLKGLTDIKSNYIIREKVILQICRKLDLSIRKLSERTRRDEVRNFFLHYTRSILRLTHSSSDETKSIKLEKLLKFGSENSNDPDNLTEMFKHIPATIRKEFQHFWDILTVENSKPLYQAVRELSKINYMNFENEFGDIELNKYKMRGLQQFLEVGYPNDASVIIEKHLKPLLSLYTLLNEKETEANAFERYNILQKTLKDVVESEAQSENVDLILFGKHQQDPSEYLQLPSYYIISPINDKSNNDGRLESVVKYVDGFLKKSKDPSFDKNGYANHSLSKDGFCLIDVKGKRYHILIELNNNYDILSKKNKPIQKIEPIYILITCKLKKEDALMLTRKILLFRCKLISWLERDFNNNSIANLSEMRHWAKLLSADKVADHAESDFIACEQKLISVAGSAQKNVDWRYALNWYGKRELQYNVHSDNEIPLGGNTSEAREWFLLRAYINARISRLYRTLVRSSCLNDILFDKKSDYYYSSSPTDTEYDEWKRPATSFNNLFFTPFGPNYTRNTYLEQIMKTVSFNIEGVNDWGDDPNATIEKRLKFVEKMCQDYDFIQLKKDEHYCSYFSEYLAILFLDCCISAVKAGECWNLHHWSASAFVELANSPANEKCKITIFREKGLNDQFDYLVIENDIYTIDQKPHKKQGMSQVAMRWYIEGLWEICGKSRTTIMISDSLSKYTVKLPILKPRGEKKQ